MLQLEHLASSNGVSTEVQLQLFDSTDYWHQFLDGDAKESNQMGGQDERLLLSSALQLTEWIVQERNESTTQSVEFNVTVKGIKPWTDECPDLYTALFTVTTAHTDGRQCTHYHAVKVGFRTISISRTGTLLLNNKPLKLKGVNRHEFNAWKGIGTFASFPSSLPSSKVETTQLESSDSKREMIRDLLMIKQSNFNAVRTSHYPNDSYFYLLCDYVGLYVVDESNIETHGLWDHFSDNPTYPPIPLLPLLQATQQLTL